ncbi:Subtilisin [Plasmodiophora brassicae]
MSQPFALLAPLVLGYVLARSAIADDEKRNALSLAVGADAHPSERPGSYADAVAQCARNGGTLISIPTLASLYNPDFIAALRRTYTKAQGVSEMWIMDDKVPSADAAPADRCAAVSFANPNVVTVSQKPCSTIALFGLCFGGPVVLPSNSS